MAGGELVSKHHQQTCNVNLVPGMACNCTTGRIAEWPDCDCPKPDGERQKHKKYFDWRQDRCGMCISTHAMFQGYSVPVAILNEYKKLTSYHYLLSSWWIRTGRVPDDIIKKVFGPLPPPESGPITTPFTSDRNPPPSANAMEYAPTCSNCSLAVEHHTMHQPHVLGQCGVSLLPGADRSIYYCGICGYCIDCCGGWGSKLCTSHCMARIKKPGYSCPSCENADIPAPSILTRDNDWCVQSNNTPEPPPIPNIHRPVWELVVKDMQERNRVGTAKYGTPLQPFNGRDALVDAYQEALDLAVYLKQRIIEEAGGN